MKASISRNVHFVDESGVHRAAIVTAVRSKAGDVVDLAVFGTRGMRNVDAAEEDPSGKKTASWHWPEREEPEKPATPPK